MADIIPEGEQGIARIEHYVIDEQAATFTQLRPLINAGRPGSVAVRPGRYCRLMLNGGTLMMSDTDMERRSNREFVREARGQVIIAGLGLGMVLTAILPKPEVHSVYVIEQSQDVIDLVEPHIRATMGEHAKRKLAVECADIFEWPLPKKKTWDTIYFDIWSATNIPLDESTRLKRRFARRRREGGWMGSWNEAETRAFNRRCGF
jgi:predicted membrane-bound spermidine synthase